MALCVLVWLLVCVTPSWVYAQAQGYNKQAPSAQDLIAWWRGDPGFSGGTKLYNKVGHPHGTLTSMGTAGTTSGWGAGTRPKSKSEVRFDGTNDYVDIPFTFTLDVTKQYTWAFWIYPKSFVGWHTLWSQVITPGAQPSVLLYIQSNTDANFGNVTNGVSIGIETGSSTGLYAHTTPNAIVLNTWQFLVITYDGAAPTNAEKFKIYVNAINKTDTADIAVGGGGLPTTQTYQVASIGRDTFGDPTFSGAVDDVKVYKKAFRPSDVAASMQQGRLGEPELLPQPLAVGYVPPPPPFDPLSSLYAGKPATTLNVGTPTAQGLIGWWRGIPNFTGGPLWYDLTGRFHATNTNMATAGTTSGWVGPTRPSGQGEVRFDGVNDYSILPVSSQLWPQAVSILLWVKRTATGGDYQGVFAGGDNGGYRDITVRASGGMNVSFVTSTASYLQQDNVNPGSVPIGVWTHVAYTYSSTTGLQGYVNCIPNGAPNSPSGTMYPITTLGTIFGASSPTLGPFTGALDDIKLYDRALPAREVCQVMQESQRGEPQLLPSSFLVGILAPLTGSKSRFFPFFQAP